MYCFFQHFQKDVRGLEGYIVTGSKQAEIGTKLSEDSRKYGVENTCTSRNSLSKAAVGFARARSQMEKERTNLLKALGTQAFDFLGCLVRQIIPYTIDDWRHITNDMKQVLWASIQQKYILNEGRQKRYVFMNMARLWRASKSRLVRDIRETTDEQILKELKPDNFPSDQVWKAFVKKKKSAECTAKSEKFKSRRSNQTPYTSSRKGYARLATEMMRKSENPSSISRVDVWIKGHTKKDGTPVNTTAANTIEGLKKLAKESSSMPPKNFSDDPLSQVVGPEPRGQVRGVGFGVTPSQLTLLAQRDNSILQLQQQINSMNDKMSNMQSIIDNYMKIQKESQDGEKGPDVPISFDKNASSQLLSEKCKMLCWLKTGKIVVEGSLSSADPKTVVHGIPLGPDAIRVWVDVVKEKDALLWRPTSYMTHMEEALGTTVAWPTKYVVMQ